MHRWAAQTALALIFSNDGQLAIFHDDFMLTKELTRTVAGDPTEITVYAIRSPSRYDRMS